jgi:hypothetical protein
VPSSPVTSSSKPRTVPLTTTYVVCLLNLHPVIIRPQFEYMLETFDLLEPLQGFQLLFLIYNFVFYMKTRISECKLKYNGKTLGTLLSKDLPAFTSRNSSNSNSKRQNDDGGSNGGQGGAKKGRRGGRTLNQPTVSSALTEKGYHLQLEEGIEGWTPRHPVRHLSVNEILINIKELIR